MHRASWLSIGIAVLLVLPAPARLQGQSERKVLTMAKPAYPDLARRANISGVVKLVVTVHPNGAVNDARIAGGNPVLCNAAMDAVRKWKFEPSAIETTEIVQLRFQPN